jgi:metallo-beta-lactamase family protein
MQITCLGAARTVTGSCYKVELDNGNSFLVDCGMYQGDKKLEERNWDQTLYEPRKIKAVFITHAHIDHSGLVPRLVRMGYRGPVFATEPTCELLKILWQDSAHIQEMESQWQTRKNKRQLRKTVEPLYNAVDAEDAIKLLEPVELACLAEPLPGLEVCYYNAGHILGAASLYITSKNGDKSSTVVFSGDLGRPGQLIVPDAETPPKPDAVFMETTYGNRQHKSLEESQEELIQVVNQASAEGGKVLIPAFAVERTQEIIYTLAKACREGRLPNDIPVFLDSPLAIKATEIFRKHPDYFDDEAQSILENGQRPLDMPNLKFSLTTKESMALNDEPGPHVIIAGAGMCNAGRIKHHLKHNLWQPSTHVVIVGFQAQGSTGRKLVDGAKKVRIFREEVAVKATVHTIGGFSAHADANELFDWLEPLVHPELKVFLTHGEESATLDFMKEAKRRFSSTSFYVPQWQEKLKIVPGAGLPKAAPLPAKAAGRPSAVRPAALAAGLAALSQELIALAAKAAQGEASREEMEQWEKGLVQTKGFFASKRGRD